MFWRTACTFAGAPNGVETMEILAINAMNIEGQVATSASMRAASNTQSNGEFAAELDRNLQGKNDPILTSRVNEPAAGPGKSSSSEDGNLCPQAFAPSAVTLAAPLAAVSVTPPNNSSADNRPTSNSDQAPPASRDNATSVLSQTGVEEFSPHVSMRRKAADGVNRGSADAPSPTSPPPPARETGIPQTRGGARASSPVAHAVAYNLPPSTGLPKSCVQRKDAVTGLPVRNADLLVGTASTFAVASPDTGLKALSVKRGTPAEASPALPPSPLPPAFPTGQHGSTDVAESTSKQMDPLDARSPSSSGKGLESATPAPLQNVTTPLELQDPSTRTGGIDATGPISPGKGLQSATPAPLQNVRTELELQGPSGGPNPKTGESQDKGSKGPSASPATPTEASSTLQPSHRAQVLGTGPHGSANGAGSASERSGPIHTTSASNLSEGSQSGTLASLQNVTPRLELQGPSTRTEAFDAASRATLGKGSQSMAVKTTVPLPNVTTQLGPNDPPQQIDTLDTASPATLGKGSQGAALAPLQNVTTELELQDPLGQIGALDTTSPTNSSNGPHSVTVETIASSKNATTQRELQNPSALTEALDATSPSGLGKGPQIAAAKAIVPLPNETVRLGLQDPSESPDPEAHASPIKASNASSPSHATPTEDSSTSHQSQTAQVVTMEQAESTLGTGSEATPAALATLQPSVHDTKQPNASTDKKGGEAAPDIAKAVDGKGDLTKTNIDPPLAPQLTPQGRAESGRAFSEATGTSPGWREADSASALQGYQTNGQGAVSAARLTQQAGNAEMQVRLRTEALGSIDVRTIVKGSDIGASIRVEAHDTQVMLTNELSQLERALNERSLRVEHLDVLQGSVSGGHSNGTGPGYSDGRASEPRPNYARHSAGQTYGFLPEAPIIADDGALGLSTTRINLRV